MAKRKQHKRDAVTLWRGKVARIIGQSSDEEVLTLGRLIWHKGLDSHEKYLVLEGAIFDVISTRMADREEERRTRRKRAREQAAAQVADTVG